jgi:hypothetical protein
MRGKFTNSGVLWWLGLRRFFRRVFVRLASEIRPLFDYVLSTSNAHDSSLGRLPTDRRPS